MWKLTEGARCALAGRARPRAPARNHQEDYKVFHKRSNADHLQVDSVSSLRRSPSSLFGLYSGWPKETFWKFYLIYYTPVWSRIFGTLYRKRRKKPKIAAEQIYNAIFSKQLRATIQSRCAQGACKQPLICFLLNQKA